MTNSSELPLPQPSADAMADRSIAIKVIGVGGAGSNAVDRLKMDSLDRLRLAAINTDLQALNSSPVEEKLLIGSSVTRGLGAGGDPEIGHEAAESDREKISEMVADCDLVFLIAGMGGGTGSGGVWGTSLTCPPIAPRRGPRVDRAVRLRPPVVGPGSSHRWLLRRYATGPWRCPTSDRSVPR